MDRRERELLLEELDSRGFRLFAEQVVRRVHAWMAELVENAELDEAKRKGYVNAIASLKEGMTGFYDQAGVSLPSWLDKELNYYRNHDDA